MDGKLFLTAAALLLVAACTKEDPGAAFRSDPDAVRITAQVGDGLSGGFVTTRSNPVSEIPGEQAAFKAGDRISVTADGQKKVVYTLADDGSWNPEAGKYLKWTSRTMTFSACYPAADGVSTERFTVPADQSDADKIAAADYMTFSDPVTRGSNNGVTLAMTRKMVRIVLEPDIQNQFGEGYSISELKVHGNRKGYSGGNLVNGDVAVKAYKLNGKFYALLPPTTENANAVFIDVTVTKDGVSETLQAKGIPATEAGNSYTVSLTVGKNVASVTEVSISEWGTTSTPIANGEEAVLVPYITFTAEAEQTFTMNFQPQSVYDAFSLGEGDYFEYSVGGGKWTRFTSTISYENAVAFGGAKGNLRLRGKSSKGTAVSDTNYSTISFGNTTAVSCTGDIRTLIDYKSYASANTENARFCYLFSGCTALSTAPELPAITLADYCYYFMFNGCSSLTTAPELPARTLKDRCYCYMFNGCSSLTTAPELPAQTLDVYCYAQMFQSCTSLKTAPALPATELKEACYYATFQGCTSLTTAPVLHATTLVQGCYHKIFNDCQALENVTMLATDGFDTNGCLNTWLGYYKEYGDGNVEDCSAGKNASTRKLTLANVEVYNKLVAKESTDEKTWITDYWKKDANGTTVVYKDNSSGLGEGGSEI